MGKRRTIVKAMKPIARLLISTAAGLAVQNILNTKFNSDVLKRYKSESTESIFRNIKISAGDLVDDSKVHAHVGNIVGFGVSLGTFTVLGGGKEIVDAIKDSVKSFTTIDVTDISNSPLPDADEMEYLDFPCICNGRVVHDESEYYKAKNNIKDVTAYSIHFADPDIDMFDDVDYPFWFRDRLVCNYMDYFNAKNYIDDD